MSTGQRWCNGSCVMGKGMCMFYMFVCCVLTGKTRENLGHYQATSHCSYCFPLVTSCSETLVIYFQLHRLEMCLSRIYLYYNRWHLCMLMLLYIIPSLENRLGLYSIYSDLLRLFQNEIVCDIAA